MLQNLRICFVTNIFAHTKMRKRIDRGFQTFASKAIEKQYNLAPNERSALTNS